MSEVEGRDDLDDLRRRIYHYRRAGDTVEEIADKLSLPPLTVVKYFREFTTELGRRAAWETSDVAKALEMARLEKLLSSHWEFATEEHQRPMLVGAGPTQHIEMVTMPPDVPTAKFVLDIIKQRSRMSGMEVVDPISSSSVQNILIIGNDQKAYLEALAHGRQKPALDSADPDNEVVGEVAS